MRMEEGRRVEQLKMFPLFVKGSYQGPEMSILYSSAVVVVCACVRRCLSMHELAFMNVWSQLIVRIIFVLVLTPSRMRLNESAQSHPACVCVCVSVIVCVKGLMGLRLVLR